MWMKRILRSSQPWWAKTGGIIVHDGSFTHHGKILLQYVCKKAYADAPKGCIRASSYGGGEMKCAGGGGKGGGGKGGGKCPTCPPPPPRRDSLECHPARLQYFRDVELGVNCQIQAELEASYFYTSLASTFGRVDVALRGIELFFWRCANQERNDAIKLANYQNQRGGIVCLSSVQDPGSAARTTCTRDALANSLQIQRNLTNQLINLYKVANDHNDPVTCDFLSEFFLMKQVKRMSRNGRLITQLCRVGDTGMGLHEFDEWIYENVADKKEIAKGEAKSRSGEEHSVV